MNTPRIPTAKDVMSTKVITLDPGTPVMQAAQLLLEKNVSGAPVVDSGGKLVGLLSEFDCMKDMAAENYHQDHDTINRVADLMTPKVLCVPPDKDIFGLAQIMTSSRVRRLVIRGEDEKIVGIVSRRDVFQALHQYYKQLGKSGKGYPDYPQSRKPIRDYPSD